MFQDMDAITEGVTGQKAYYEYIGTMDTNQEKIINCGFHPTKIIVASGYAGSSYCYPNSLVYNESESTTTYHYFTQDKSINYGTATIGATTTPMYFVGSIGDTSFKIKSSNGSYGVNVIAVID